jgi:hypothetical protein
VVQVFLGVFVGALLDIKEELMFVVFVAAEELVLFWDFVLNLHSEDGCSLIGPAS